LVSPKKKLVHWIPADYFFCGPTFVGLAFLLLLLWGICDFLGLMAFYVSTMACFVFHPMGFQSVGPGVVFLLCFWEGDVGILFPLWQQSTSDRSSRCLRAVRLQLISDHKIKVAILIMIMSMSNPIVQCPSSSSGVIVYLLIRS
jgi:hypothetical protein